MIRCPRFMPPSIFYLNRILVLMIKITVIKNNFYFICENLEHRIILPYIKFSNGGLIISLFPYGSLFGEQDLILTIITAIVNLKPLSMFFNRTATVVVFDWFIA